MSQRSLEGQAGVDPSATRPRWGLLDLEELSQDEIWDLFLDDVKQERQAGREVTLAYYLERVPGIRERRDVLHAAITAAIESATARGQSRSSAFRSLINSHPELEPSIDDVWAVDDLLGSTETLRGRLVGDPIQLPAEFGPVWREGERRYRLTEQIASGSRGEVYLAKDRSLSDPAAPALVAIKLVPEWLHVEPEELLREGARARRVIHPNVARVLEAGHDQEHGLYLAFEYVEGTTLDVRGRHQADARSQREAVKGMMPLLDGLATAHERGVAHLDIHPRNVLVRPSGEPVLIDFGLGVAVSDMGGPLRRAVGALGFVSPEMFRGTPGIDPMGADVYSIAGLLWWLLTGTVPNGSTTEQIEARLTAEQAQANTAPSPLGGQQLEPDLRLVLERGLRFSAEDRTASVRALQRDLENWLDYRPIGGQATSPWKRAKLFTRRSPASIAIAASIIGLTAIASGGLAWQRSEHLSREKLNAAAAEAREAELDSQAAEARAQAAETEAQRAADTRRAVNSLELVVASSGQEGVTKDWAIALTLLRDLYAEGEALDAQALDKVREARIQHAQNTIDSLLATHNETDTIVLFWRAMLGSSLADASRYQEAAEVLRQCVEQLAAVLNESDPMLFRLRVLEACCRYQAERTDHAYQRLQSALLAAKRSELPTRLAVLVESSERLRKTQHSP